MLGFYNCQPGTYTQYASCGSASLIDDPHSTIDASSNLYVTASYNVPFSGAAIDIEKLSPAGASLWNRTYAALNTYTYQSNAVSLDGAGNVYVAGGLGQGNGNYLTLKYAAQLTTRINAGGSNLATTLGAFSADVYSAGSTATGISTAGIAGKTDDALYQTYRQGNTPGGSFSYNIPVVNGNYTVNLHFTEATFTAAGQRKFNVSAEGLAWLSNYDIAANRGVNTARVKTKAVTVTDGNLTLNFTSLVSYARVSAIEVIATPAPNGRQSVEKAELANLEADQTLQAFPNPFTDKITISFLLAKTSLAKLEVYTLQGQLVRRLFEGEAEGGKLYELEMEGTHLNNGMYISRLSTPAKTESKKIVLAR